MTTPLLGILELERGTMKSTPLPGGLTNPSTFSVPLILETVDGAWADRVIAGDPALEPAYIAAAKRLVERGATAITANCGFAIRHQSAVAAAVDVPVVMSSLLMLPMLLRQLPPQSKLAVLTADSTKCDDDVLGLHGSPERDRVVVAGIEGGTLLRNEMVRPPIPTTFAEIEEDVRGAVARLLRDVPDVSMMLFECTAFPLVTDAIRKSTEVPIYDVVDLCRLTLASVSKLQ
ncbi:hypothetical protein SAMN04488498_1594 [Mesorhizobium albiziae]|uniref:Aspartate/glutamate racemase family protein n=1 Tax=Neomesorhizobium albiziae TaxID=335020 RepID=A0A1I4FTF9_9HYPH|nr:hypothetical protein [Mesorhizobium albiziae]SFL21114.1 hypothetical protein SAMN04488498_1594 [Mesorhizobium albiziae]